MFTCRSDGGNWNHTEGNPIMPFAWPEQPPTALATISCQICGAIIGLKFGISPNSTDGTDLHAEWHRKNGDDGDA